MKRIEVLYPHGLPPDEMDVFRSRLLEDYSKARGYSFERVWTWRDAPRNTIVMQAVRDGMVADVDVDDGDPRWQEIALLWLHHALGTSDSTGYDAGRSANMLIPSV